MEHPDRATVAAHLLMSAKSLGVDFVFTNLGSDHPAFIQAFAALDEAGRAPEIICCPHEMTALSAAHGYAMITRHPQLVLVHVDVGTQNLGCSVHNAARGRIPAIIVAGLSPVSLDGGRLGTRTEYIHYTQDVPSQPEIVRQYMKWIYELRAPESVRHAVLRSHQIASSEPQGPVYLTGGRELWEELAAPAELKASPPAVLGGITVDGEARIWDALARAERPLIITSHLGRSPRAVERLVALSDRLALAVEEVTPQYLNFPGDHPNHVGYVRDRHVDQADFILVLDSDVPWLPKMVQPAAATRVFVIDADPLKETVGLWSYPVDASYRADTGVALEQLLRRAEDGPEATLLAARRAWIAQAKQAVEPPPAAQSRTITPQSLSDAVAQLIDDDTIVIAEALSAMPAVLPRLRMARPGSFFASGGAGLGWGINAAVGAKLAKPGSTVITLVGDGAYLFGVPSSAYWVAKQYDTPTLTIIYNNGGWHSPKRSSELVHGSGGHAGASDRYWVTISRDARLADVAAAAGNAVAYDVSDPGRLPAVLHEALAAVREGRSAVVNAILPPISQQRLGRRGASGR